MQTNLKNKPQVYMLLFGIFTLWTLYTKLPFKTSLLFYVLLGTMLYINIVIIANLLANMINPNDGWHIDSGGTKHRIMQMNWIWGAAIGLILSPLSIIFYHKKVQRNKTLEIILTTIFILTTAFIYIRQELL